ncbi:MAG: RsmB/NOP family class I SAM-dependent RNA methyltransferase [Prolixibacteraceae bacterium]|nr:RsmB/NOP family class I SAM-dependent RNA methyltransferase [Prolixibacteraceae bacterium]
MKIPEAFVKRVETDLKNGSGDLLNALDREAPVSIRANPLKGYKPEGMERVPWSYHGYYLPERPVFTLDPLFHAGTYYVQEASSMFLEQIMKGSTGPNQLLKVLDLCAAPGGKSTHLASLLPPGSLLVSNEIIRSRAKILAENMTKWGYPNVIVTNNAPADFQRLKGFFDVLVVDAPCSGEGMFRKDTNARAEWSANNVAHSALRQRRIVADAWDSLKEGGIIIYSTCTFNKHENEENLKWMIREMGAQPLPFDFPVSDGIEISTEVPGFRFYPHKIKGEGFFISVLQKTTGSDFKSLKNTKSILHRTEKSIQKNLSPWIKNASSFCFFSFRNKVLAFPSACKKELHELTGQMNIVQAGIEVCEIKGKDLIPSHSLAMSVILNTKAFIAEELDLNKALSYLKKEDIKPSGTDRYLLATYRQTPLGFLKKAGNRYNNLYPKEWRIRMEIDS